MKCPKCGYENKDNVACCDLCKEVLIKPTKIIERIEPVAQDYVPPKHKEISRKLLTLERIAVLGIILFSLISILNIYFANPSKVTESSSSLKRKWVAQFGTGQITGMALDQSGNLVIVGYGQIGEFLYGAYSFLAKYDVAGKRIFSKQFGVAQGLDKIIKLDVQELDKIDWYLTRSGEYASGDHGVVAVNKVNGDIAIAITSKEVSISNVNDIKVSDYSDYNVILSIFDSNGVEKKMLSFGTERNDIPRGIAIDERGNIYVSGNSGNHVYNASIFLYKFDSLGNKLWDRHFVSLEDSEGGIQDKLRNISGLDAAINCGLAIDSSGNIWLAGSRIPKEVDDSGPAVRTRVSQKEIREMIRGQSNNKILQNMVIIKVDSSSNDLLRKNFAVPNRSLVQAKAMTMDEDDNIYVVGEYFSDDEGGRKKGFVSKINAKGIQKYFNVIQTNGINTCEGITGDGKGSIYVTGICDNVVKEVESSKDIYEKRETQDTYFAKLNTSGQVKWIEKYKGKESGKDISVLTNSSGELFVSGSTTDTDKAGSNDVFISLWKME